MGWLVAFVVAAIVLIAIWNRGRSRGTRICDKGWSQAAALKQRFGGESSKSSLEIITRIEKHEEQRGARQMPAPAIVGGSAFAMSYADADGAITERVIRVNEVTCENGFVYINAHCFLADAKGTFRSDRIHSMGNHRAGEQIWDPIKFFAMFYDEEDDLVLSHEP
jgi:predicted DNA-binding transcriptional regulator YafY